MRQIRDFYVHKLNGCYYVEHINGYMDEYCDDMAEVLDFINLHYKGE